jgi:hypothetical protein
MIFVKLELITETENTPKEAQGYEKSMVHYDFFRETFHKDSIAVCSEGRKQIVRDVKSGKIESVNYQKLPRKIKFSFKYSFRIANLNRICAKWKE